MKELTLNQEAAIYQAIYRQYIPNYIPDFYVKKKFQNDEDGQYYLNLINSNEPIGLSSEHKASDPDEEDGAVSYLSRFIICDICGLSGHDSTNCKGIPTINDIELSIKNDIKYAEMKIKIDSEKKKKELNSQNQTIDADIMNTRIYAEDYFGLYVVGGGENEPIKTDGSLDKDLYCINCGKKGHIFSNCQKPTLSKILENVEISNNKEISPTSIKNRFDRFWNHQYNH